MQTPEAVLSALAADQFGMITRSQALGAGVSRHAIDLRLSDGRLTFVHEGVYRHPAVPPTWRGRLMAGVLAAGRGAAASHRSAGRLHGYRGVPPWRPELTMSATDLPLRSGVDVHRTNRLDAADLTVVDGIPCTSRPRTLLDLGAVLPYEVVEVAVQDAIIRKLVSHEELFAVLERVGGRGRRGTSPLRAVVRHALPDERLESELERLLFALFPANHGCVLQYELTCVDGRRVRLDAARPELRLAIEANGLRWHGTAKDMRRDMARRRAIKASGWDLWEYGWADVVETPDAVRVDLARLLAQAA